MLKKIIDVFVFSGCMIGCIIFAYFCVCYLDIVGHNLGSGYDYPDWNILATTIEKAGQ